MTSRDLAERLLMELEAIQNASGPTGDTLALVNEALKDAKRLADATLGD